MAVVTARQALRRGQKSLSLVSRSRGPSGKANVQALRPGANGVASPR